MPELPASPDEEPYNTPYVPREPQVALRCDGGPYVSGCHPSDDPVWDIVDEMKARDLQESIDRTSPTVCDLECTEDLMRTPGQSEQDELEDRVACLEREAGGWAPDAPAVCP
jgi:hypothetical protein